MMIATLDFDQNMVVLDSITEESVGKIYSYNAVLTKMRQAGEPMEVFVNSYQKFLEDISDIEKGKPFQLKNDVIRILNDFFSATLKYIDNIKVILINTFNNKVINPNKSSKKIILGNLMHQEITSKIYDKSFEYRLVYNVRNYIQHVGHSALSLHKDKGGIKILLNREQYMEEHSGIQSGFKTELSKSNVESFEMVNVITKYFKDIIELDSCFKSTLVENKLAEFLEAAYKMVVLLPDKKEKEQFILVEYLSDISTEESRQNIDMRLINVEEPFAKLLIDTNIKEFSFDGIQSHLESDGFPVITEEGIILKGAVYVQQKDLLWEKYRENISFTGSYYALYFRKFMEQETKDILAKVLEK